MKQHSQGGRVPLPRAQPAAKKTPLSAADEAWLREAAGTDEAKLQVLREQAMAGVPTAYVAGFLQFRGRRFDIDRRAYVTDPELTHLIDVVNAEGRGFKRRCGRAPVVADFGTGAGTLAITLKLENPAWVLMGIDVDADALDVARINVRSHGVSVRLVHSEYFTGWPEDAPVPDFIFGDPPWGGDGDLYANERDAAYYHQMPARSAFPPGDNPCAIHDALIASVRERGWASRLVLNYGVLARAVVERSTAGFRDRRMTHPAPSLTIVSGSVATPPDGRTESMRNPPQPSRVAGSE